MRLIEKQRLNALDIKPYLRDRFTEINWDVEIVEDYVRDNINPSFLISNALKVYSFEKKGLRRLEQLPKDTERIKIVFAHGGSIPWSLFENNRAIMTTQDWIDENSNNYDALFIEACNPFRQMPIFRGTPILYLEGIAGTPGQCESKLVKEHNKIKAVFHNVRNAFRTHSYWSGENTYRLGRLAS